MGKRKVATSRTRGHRTLTGYNSTTTAYVHEDGPGKMTRLAAFTGVSPYNPKRAAISVWVLVFVALANLTAWLPWVFVLVTLAVLGAQRLGRRKIPAARPAVPVGPVWCDHCADWTVHPTDQHAPAA